MLKKLNEYNVDEDMQLVVLLKSAEPKMTKTNKQYIAMTFEDSSGVLRGNFWDATKEDIQLFQSGTIVELEGQIELYQNNPQVKILSLRKVDESEGYNLSQFVKSAPMTAAKMQEEIDGMFFEIVNPTWQRIVRNLLQKYREQFYEYPAAKTVHHAMRGGLAFHTLSILRLAKSVSDQYPQVDRSLLYAGAILHDLGKTIELTGAAGTEYTVTGNLIGHIVLIDEEIVRAAENMDIDQNSEDFLMLRHMILSHHGLQEYGSPVRPQILEAEILHHLDELDANINTISSALEKTAAGQYTDRLFSLDNRRFYQRKNGNKKA